MDARQLALNVLCQIETRQSYSEDVLKRELSKAGLKPNDQALAHELVAGVLRNRLWLDSVLEPQLKKGLASLNVFEINILRLGLYQIAKLDRIPLFAAVNESVKLCKRFGRKSIIGLTNAVLRDIIRHQRHLKPISSGEKARDLSLTYSHPIWLVKLLINEIGERETALLLQADNTQAPVTIRPNTLKTTGLELQEKLGQSGYRLSSNKYITDALEAENPQGLADDPLFIQGYFYFQDASSQAVTRLFRATSGTSMLDLCAAPGGKASAAQEQMKDQGLLMAVDISYHKLELVRQNFDRLGLKKYSLVCADSTAFSCRKQFDLVTVDAPCSGLGALRRRLDLRWRLKEEDIPRLANLQSRILDNAAGLVKPGGVVVYSTCTVIRQENEGVIEGFLKTHQDFKLDDAEKYIPRELVSNGYFRVWPHQHGMDGAFGARMLKTKS
jgi:16S rRNA (cytosine967-C5)-methyltransferase